MKKYTKILSLLTILAAATIQESHTRRYDYVLFSENDSQYSNMRLDSNSKFFKTAHKHKKETHLETLSSGDKVTAETETSLIFQRYLLRSEVPVKCQHLFDFKPTKKGVKPRRFRANIVRYNSQHKKCYHLKFLKAARYILVEDNKSIIMFTHKSNGFHYTEKFIFQNQDSEHKYGLEKIDFVDKTSTGTNFHEYHYTFYVDPEDITFTIPKDSDYSIKIRDPSRSHILRLNKNNYIVKHPIIKRKNRYVTYSLNFGNYLTPDQMPNKNGCKPYTHVKANYMFEEGSQCAYGKFSRMPKVSIERFEEDAGRQKVVMIANHFEGQEFYIILESREKLGDKDTDYRRANFLRHEGTFFHRDLLYLRFEVSEYKIIADGYYHRLRLTHAFLLLLIPAFFILMFNEDYHTQGLYCLQFGIIFNFVSQISLSIVEWYELEKTFIAVYGVFILGIGISMLLSLRRLRSIVFLWKIFTLVDYVLMALLMRERGTLFYAAVNVVVFKALTILLKLNKGETRYMEISISFFTSLCMLNLVGNIMFYTTSLKRIIFLMEGLKLHDKHEALYYLGFGVICSLLSFARLFMTDHAEWNVKARIPLPNFDPDASVSIGGKKEVELGESLDSEGVNSDEEEEE